MLEYVFGTIQISFNEDSECNFGINNCCEWLDYFFEKGIMNIFIKISIAKIVILFAVGNVFSQSQWDIQLIQSNLNCSSNEVCYRLQMKNSSGSAWTLADQNYRLFFDGDIMTVNSVTSLLPDSTYSSAVIDNNVKFAGQGQEVGSPLDDIDDNLGFLDFSIALMDKSDPSTNTQLTTSSFIPIAEICLSVTDVTAEDCLTFYHSRPSTAGSFTSEYTVVTENNLPNITTAAEGVGFDDLTPMDGDASCFDYVCEDNQWDESFTQVSIDCGNQQVCYQLLLKSAEADWTISNQNYRIFYDGDLMTVQSVTSLLPGAYYGAATVTQDVKISGQGQENFSPLDDIDDNLGFLDFFIVQTNKSNPDNAVVLTNVAYTPIVEICLEVTTTAINDLTGNQCLKMYQSRNATAGSITNEYTTISENNLPNNTTSTTGRIYLDLTPENNPQACLGSQCNCNAEGQTLSK